MSISFIADILRKRKEKGISQRDLAKKTGIPQSSIARMESGKVEPNLRTLEKICNALDMELVMQPFSPMRRWEGLEFTCYWKDEPISEVHVRGNRAHIKRFVKHPVKQIFSSDNISLLQLTEVLESRCWERDRANIRSILRTMKLETYDPLAIVQKNHGVSYDDFLWIRFAGEDLEWAKVAPRSRNV